MQDYESFLCEECGLYGFKNEPESVAGHKRWHEILVKGFISPKTVNDNVIWENGDYWISEVNITSKLSQRKKAEKASLAINKAIWQEDFSYSSYYANDVVKNNNLHLFLIHRLNRVIGLVVTKKEQCLEAKWDADELSYTKKITENPIVVIEMVWLVVSQRGKGLAKKSVFAIAQYFSIEPQSLGWSSPFSKSGNYLAKLISPTTLYVYSSGM